MIKSVRIESDGTAQGTTVFSATGEKLGGVVSIHIDPIKQDVLVTAHLTFVGVKLDLVANQEDSK